MIVVTGGAGFIGSNLISYLNQIGRKDILIVDDLTDGRKINNLRDLYFLDYMDWEDSLTEEYGIPGYDIEEIYHLGAISSTREMNGRALMRQNYEYSIRLFAMAANEGIPVRYASSASVYGITNFGKPSKETDDLFALNPYAFSKLMIERWLADHTVPVTTFRLFNVYGEREEHKIKIGQASPITTFRNEAKNDFTIEIFQGSGIIERDFIWVGDVVKFMAEFPSEQYDVFNLGTGKTETFLDIANWIATQANSRVVYIPFPHELRDKYQYYTCADMTKSIAVWDSKNLPFQFKTVYEHICGLGVNG